MLSEPSSLAGMNVKDGFIVEYGLFKVMWWHFKVCWAIMYRINTCMKFLLNFVYQKLSKLVDF